MVEDIHKIMYSSSAVDLFSQEALNDLMTLSREKNRHFSVTGCLIYHDGNIIQYLEGPPNSVSHIFECIKADPRHKGIIELCNTPVEQRVFNDWQMALKYIPSDRLRDYQTVYDLFEDMMEQSRIEQICQQARIFFETFLDVACLQGRNLGLK